MGFVGGAIPNAIEWCQDNSVNPIIQADIYDINIDNACKIIFCNRGNEDAKVTKITVNVIDENYEIISTNSSIDLPMLLKPLKNGNIIWEEREIKFDGYILKSNYIVKVIIEGNNFETVENEKTIEIL